MNRNLFTSKIGLLDGGVGLNEGDASFKTPTQSSSPPASGKLLQSNCFGQRNPNLFMRVSQPLRADLHNERQGGIARSNIVQSGA